MREIINIWFLSFIQKGVIMRRFVPKQSQHHNDSIWDELMNNSKLTQIKINTLLTTVFCVSMIMLLGCIGVFVKLVYFNEATRSNIQANAESATGSTEHKKVKKIEVSYPYKNVNEGDRIATNAVTFKILYTDNTIEVIPPETLTFSENTYEPLPAGASTITITYNGKEYPFTVNANKTVSENIKQSPDETSARITQEEMDNADYSYEGNNLQIAIFRHTEPDTYFISHVITGNNNVPEVALDKDILKEASSIEKNQQLHEWIFGVNGSYYDEDYLPDNPLYIYNGKILIDGDSSGNELCITDEGELFTPKTGIPASKLTEAGVKWTAVSENPVIINNGEKAELPEKESMLPKTVIGMVNKHEYYIITNSNGTKSSDMTYKDIQNILYEKGCSYAKALSSGSNVSLMFNGEVINQNTVDDKPIIDCFVFYDR